MSFVTLLKLPDPNLKKLLWVAFAEAGFNIEFMGDVMIATDHSIWIATPPPLEGYISFPDTEYVLDLTHDELVEHIKVHEVNILKSKDK